MKKLKSLVPTIEDIIKLTEKDETIILHLPADVDRRIEVGLSPEQWQQLPNNLQQEILNDNLTLNEFRYEIKRMREQQKQL